MPIPYDLKLHSQILACTSCTNIPIRIAGAQIYDVTTGCMHDA